MDEFPKTHTIFVPRAEAADPVPLQKKAAEYAQKYGLNPWEQWFGLRGNEWAFVFVARGNAAWLFRCYCATKQITARTQWCEWLAAILLVLILIEAWEWGKWYLGRRRRKP